MAKATLTISSKNYSSWSLRGWLLCEMSGLAVTESRVSIDDPDTRAELLLLSPSFLVPALTDRGVKSWGTWAIAEYLAETYPDAGLFPKDPAARAHCRSVSGEMHSGFPNLRSALPMNLRARHRGFKVWVGAQPDIDRILAIWRECLSSYGGPFLFGKAPTVADAMYAPVCMRFHTYDVKLDGEAAGYCRTIMDWAPMKAWFAEAQREPDELDELDVEF
ncbi:glutathione S-transferase family protein [Phreatobacter sp.]|uniref:glutathione S-transferase family protein n=1 Tax=Phreatobacter sp. TaxID=1966341 RepID=UPI003F71A02E